MIHIEALTAIIAVDEVLTGDVMICVLVVTERERIERVKGVLRVLIKVPVVVVGIVTVVLLRKTSLP